MMACQRGDAPPLLRRYEAPVAQDYMQRRQANPGFQFQWPRREGVALADVAREALGEMTGGRCSYCDAYPIQHVASGCIDHFRPKSRAEFYHLVFQWENLFLACPGCNLAKHDGWDEALLRPDESGFEFARYFLYHTDSGELQPNPAALPGDRNRAEVTIRIFGLNRAAACSARRSVVKGMLRATEEDIGDFGYRFLWPLCRDV